MNDPVATYEEKKLPTTFDNPCPTNSWLPSTSSPVRAAREREMDTASVRANKVTASDAGASCVNVSKLKSGTESGGSVAGTAPTSRRPDRPAPACRNPA